MDEQNATPDDGGATTLTRLERYLAVEDAPKESKQEEPKAQAAEPADNTASEHEPDDGGDEQASEPQITTSDLAKYLGIDETALDLDEDGTVKLKTKIDGQEGAAKLADLLKSYQLEGHINKRSMELAEREKAMQAQVAQVQQQFSQELTQARRLNQFALNELTREYQSIDWNALDQQDPGQAARLWQKYQDRIGQIQGSLHHIAQQEHQLAEQAKQRHAQGLAQEIERLPDLIKEWKDPEVRTKEAKEIAEWCQKVGYTPQFIQALNTSSALDVMTVRKAMLYDKLQASKPEVENKVRTAPKLVKPGQAPAETGQNQKLQNLKHTIVKSGGKRGIADYLLASGKV